MSLCSFFCFCKYLCINTYINKLVAIQILPQVSSWLGMSPRERKLQTHWVVAAFLYTETQGSLHRIILASQKSCQWLVPCYTEDIVLLHKAGNHLRICTNSFLWFSAQKQESMESLLNGVWWFSTMHIPSSQLGSIQSTQFPTSEKHTKLPSAESVTQYCLLELEAALSSIPLSQNRYLGLGESKDPL